MEKESEEYEKGDKTTSQVKGQPKTLTWKTDKSAEAAEVRDANY